MIKNTASQKIGAQMVTAADGTAFTGSVTVSVTVDAGTQATGSVGSGACTHEGNGYHTYAPAQAETNGDLLAFTFTGTGAVPATVQVYTIAGDAFTRLGAPAGASVSADIATKMATYTQPTGFLAATFPTGTVANTTNITAGTITTVTTTTTATNLTNAPTAGDFTATMKTSIGTAVAASAVASVTGNVGGNVAGTVASVVGAVGSVTGLTAATVHSSLTAIKNVTDLLPDAGALTSLATQASVNTIDDLLDTEIGAIDTALDAVLALLDDARTEPGQGAPPVNPDAMTKLDYLYKAWRNKKDNDGTDTRLYADNGTTVDHKQATSEAAGTVTKAEWITGA